MSSPPMQPPGNPQVLVLPTAPPPPPVRHALGLPAGSVRALLTLMVVGLVCALVLIPPRAKDQNYIPIPAYLLYLLFLVLGHYFAARGNVAKDYAGPHPLYLPRGTIRLALMVALIATFAYKLATNAVGLEEQFRASVLSIQRHPILPLVLLGGFFLGVIVHGVIFRGRSPAFWKDLEAWIAVLALLAMVVAIIIHLVINPSLSEPLEMPTWEGFLTGIIAFYFGAR